MHSSSNRSSLQRAAACVGVIAGLSTPVLAQDWIQQLGSSAYDTPTAALSDGWGGFFVSGATSGVLGGGSLGNDDAFLARLDGAGNAIWIQQFGTSDYDHAQGLAPDKAGGVYVVGETKGALGGPLLGYHDAFIARYDESGERLWARQFGTINWDVAHAVSPDGYGGAVVVGVSEGHFGGKNAGLTDAFVTRFSDDGEQLWARRLGTFAGESAISVSPDGVGGVYVAGVTAGHLGGTNAGGFDGFVAHYDQAGRQVWVKQFGTSGHDRVYASTSDGAGGVIVAGSTQGSLAGSALGRTDAFLIRIDSSGAQLWGRQFGSSGSDAAVGLASDGLGGAIVSGFTYDGMAGPYAGGGDTFVARYDGAGRRVWIDQFGGPARDEPKAVASGGGNDALVAGFTNGSLAGPNAGITDIYLAHFSSAPCYADCDHSTGRGALDVFDFLCFQESFVNSDPFACNCDTSTDQGVCDVLDFLCFQGAYVSGCEI